MSIRYFRPMPRPSRESLTGRVLRKIKREFGAQVEPFTLHLPVPELLAATWMVCRETLLAGKGRRDGREMVAAAVSAINRCPYCEDAHSMMLMGTSGNQRDWDPYFRSVFQYSCRMGSGNEGSPRSIARHASVQAGRSPGIYRNGGVLPLHQPHGHDPAGKLPVFL